MTQLRATKPGLVLGALLGIAVFLYLRNPGPEDPEEEPTYPAVVECGFYPEELCSALFEGKGAAPQIARFCKPPHGSETLAVLRSPGNCSQLVRGLHFITRPLSAEEANCSLAYVVTVRRELALSVRQLRAIYAPQNVYCIQVDERAPKRLKAAVQTLASCLENVFTLSDVAASGFPRLQADVDCMKALVHSRFPWDHVISLGGQDFPLKTNREIVRFLRSRWDGKNLIPGGVQPPSSNLKANHSHSRSTLGTNTPESPKKTFKQEAPHNLKVYFGSAYYVLTRKFVEFVLSDVRAKDLLEWCRDTPSPEQLYWVTLNRVADAPGGAPDTSWEGNIRAVKRKHQEGAAHGGCKGHYVHDVCVYGLGDLPWLVRSPALFAGEFEFSTDPLVVTCLERRHRLRALQQAEGPVEPPWHFQQHSHFNTRLSH
ncbi:PREDICTED: beta-1,3-galactosyl-O-glycosyl-glycoprotein beta-1,6-N-acetylglucosaminyltransferase 7 [Elephantulus edwardii]|uniref:beta-1,3-galactosyl-O-glycosyl-glycoprotein beta-1,6-N-acetylglucosaminyltransferase 7 n=1 Tax=Elephantulus edwardii TaxID=28737 RepID=UPI0003F0AA99|nr:PREDICTED: beta-1,3-galactosyl-O-glycosyl-glycoprotein beta-1,6-N-acetylglucosaminyltransferase 7 [Elephantulus edwardii]